MSKRIHFAMLMFVLFMASFGVAHGQEKKKQKPGAWTRHLLFLKLLHSGVVGLPAQSVPASHIRLYGI